MSLPEIAVSVFIFMLTVIVASLRNRLSQLELKDDRAASAVVELERELNRDVDEFKSRVNQNITDLAVKLAGEYVQRKELELFRTEVIRTINEGRKEMLDGIRRIEDTLSKKVDKQ